MTIPSLHDGAKWDAFEAARQAMIRNVVQHARKPLAPRLKRHWRTL